MNELHSLLPIIIAMVVQGGILTAIIKSVHKPVVAYAGELGHLASTEILRISPPGLQTAVRSELESLSHDPMHLNSTATQAAAAVLHRVAIKYPQISLLDVLPIVTDAVQAFTAGLAPATAP